MKTSFSPKNNPRVIIIQKLYAKLYNDDKELDFPKHRFKKFIKDIVLGTIERDELIISELEDKLGDRFIFENLDKVFQTILKAATYEFLYKPNVSINIILLFTTIPARAMTPTPVMTIPNACPVIIKPINTPAVDITTAKRINNPL